MSGRSVLVRADLNVPLTGVESGALIADDFRIRAALPTLRWLAERGARLTVCSHLGRPGGRPDPRYVMEPVRRRLAELLGDVDVVVMENLRFDPGEENNDPGFVDRLVSGQDLYVDDAFGAAHRPHASVVGPPARMPSAAGRLLTREVEVLSSLFERPVEPFVAVIGGAKVSDKLQMLRALLMQVDTLLIGGGMCFTFLAAAGHEIGASLVEPDHIDTCRELLGSGKQILLPVDVLAMAEGGTLGTQGQGETAVYRPDVPPGWIGLDIGEATGDAFASEIEAAGTVLWTGPMGVFEDARFASGTRAVAAALGASSAFTVVGGGDTVAAVVAMGMANTVDHLSTGGGATLELIEKGDLPGLAALRHRHS